MVRPLYKTPYNGVELVTTPLSVLLEVEEVTPEDVATSITAASEDSSSLLESVTPTAEQPSDHVLTELKAEKDGWRRV